MIAVSNASGAVMATNSYDEFGIPASTNLGRFQYTGQAWLPELGMYYYKARIYSPTLGRFMQTDPIGYGDGPNLYNYVGGDPINGTDPSGLSWYPFASLLKTYPTPAGSRVTERMSQVPAATKDGAKPGADTSCRIVVCALVRLSKQISAKPKV